MCSGLSWSVVVAVQRVVREPEAEMLVECAAQVFLHLGAVPIGLPREGFPVEQRLDDDHLSLETARLHGPGCGGREHGPSTRGRWG